VQKGSRPDVDTRRGIIAATEHLCAQRNPATVTIRQIAAEAGVSPGLVYHYFDSRAALMAATLQHIAADIDATAAAAESPEQMGQAALAFLWERPGFARIITSMVLDGVDITAAMGDHPLIRRLGGALGGDPEVAQTRVGMVVALLLSAGAFGPGINRALDRDVGDPRLLEALSAALDDLVEARSPSR
jgi:AcrR family transcriptional regulator